MSREKTMVEPSPNQRPVCKDQGPRTKDESGRADNVGIGSGRALLRLKLHITAYWFQLSSVPRLSFIVCFLLLIVAWPAATQAGKAGGHRAHTKPWIHSGIPIQDYQFGNWSEIVSAVSTRAVFLEDTADERNQLEVGATKLPIRDVKLLQWNVPRLVVEHCAISRMALQVNRNGQWSLNLLAEQNPPDESAAADSVSDAEHLRRNRYRVRLACLGGLPEPAIGEATAIGVPVVVDLGVVEFVVQNGQPRRFVHHGQIQNLSNLSFDLINAAEIEFSFYKGTDTK